jgi:exodeoxyribonuclease-3
MGIADFDDPQKRVISAVINGIRIVCVYIPNGESVESVKYVYKLDWLRRLNACLKQELGRYPRLAVLGDYNIAPEDRDVHDPNFWAGRVLFSEPEKAAFRDMGALGLQDSFRLFEQPEKSYSWWDYRMNGFKRNLGLRIDHILLAGELAQACKSCTIIRDMRAKERPSDHAPVVAEIEI